jgi:hypothetical protein
MAQRRQYLLATIFPYKFFARDASQPDARILPLWAETKLFSQEEWRARMHGFLFYSHFHGTRIGRARFRWAGFLEAEGLRG